MPTWLIVILSIIAYALIGIAVGYAFVIFKVKQGDLDRHGKISFDTKGDGILSAIFWPAALIMFAGVFLYHKIEKLVKNSKFHPIQYHSKENVAKRQERRAGKKELKEAQNAQKQKDKERAKLDKYRKKKGLLTTDERERFPNLAKVQDHNEQVGDHATFTHEDCYDCRMERRASNNRDHMSGRHWMNMMPSMECSFCDSERLQKSVAESMRKSLPKKVNPKKSLQLCNKKWLDERSGVTHVCKQAHGHTLYPNYRGTRIHTCVNCGYYFRFWSDSGVGVIAPTKNAVVAMGKPEKIIPIVQGLSVQEQWELYGKPEMNKARGG